MYNDVYICMYVLVYVCTSVCMCVYSVCYSVYMFTEQKVKFQEQKQKLLAEKELLLRQRVANQQKLLDAANCVLQAQAAATAAQPSPPPVERGVEVDGMSSVDCESKDEEVIVNENEIDSTHSVMMEVVTTEADAGSLIEGNIGAIATNESMGDTVVSGATSHVVPDLSTSTTSTSVAVTSTSTSSSTSTIVPGAHTFTSTHGSAVVSTSAASKCWLRRPFLKRKSLLSYAFIWSASTKVSTIQPCSYYTDVLVPTMLSMY